MKSGYIIFTFWIALGLQSCMLDPCYNKESFLKHMETTVEEAVDQGDNWTEEQWKEKDKEIEKLMDECYEKYKDKLTREEKKTVFKESARYVYHRQKDKFKDFFSILDDMEIEEEAKKWVSMADEELKAIFNDVLKEDIESFIDDAVDEIENLARELKEAWKEAKQE